jgi:hypothetical protein
MRSRVPGYRRAVRTVPGLLVLLLVTACGGTDDEPDGTPISRDDVGESWPLVVDEGVLGCDGSGGVGAATFTTGGTTYALNGIALDRGIPDIDPIWAPDPNIEGMKMDIGGLTRRALELCE